MLIALLISLTLWADTNPQPLGTDFTDGLKALETKQYAPAQEIFNNLLKEHPLNTSLLYNAGLAEFHLNHLGIALGLWRKARSLGDSSRDIIRAVQEAESGLNIGDQDNSFLGETLRYLNTPPSNTLLTLLLMSMVILGVLASRYGARQKRAFWNWPIWLQTLFPLWGVLALIILTQGYQSSILRGTIIAPDVTTFATPSNEAPSLSALREGEWVYLEENSEGWWQIRSQSGSVGWIPSTSLIPFGGFESSTYF